MENKNTPAFPLPVTANEAGIYTTLSSHDNGCSFTGLSKREYFAAMALQGLCSATDANGTWMADGEIADSVAENAVKLADALLAHLSTPQP